MAFIMRKFAELKAASEGTAKGSAIPEKLRIPKWPVQSMTDWDIKKLPLCSIAISVAVHVFEPLQASIPINA